MEVEIVGIDSQVDKYDITKALAEILHSQEFFSSTNDPKARRMNFDVVLEEATVLGRLHNGRAKLRLPTQQDGQHFLDWVKQNPSHFRFNGRKPRFFHAGRPPKKATETLLKVPFVDPDVEQDRERKIIELNDNIRIQMVQIGVLYKVAHSASRAFSVEWEHDCIKKDVAWLWMHYDHKVIRIQFGDPVNAEEKFTLVVKFVSISKIAVGNDMGNPYIVFDLHTPVIIEKEDYHRTMTGDDFKDNKGFRHRLIAFDEAHASIAPYAHHLRLVLVNEADIKKFEKLCRVSGVPTPISTFKFNIEASRRRLFSVKPLGNIRRWVASLEWATSFQIESLIHNALVNTEDLLETLYRPINNLYKKDSVACADILRTFVEKLQSPSRTTAESPLDCWNQVMKGINDREPLGTPPGMFSCRHVTFTPTRLILEGPYAIQSNRVIRRYRGSEDAFIRVDFRDEDRLQYRWDREVDGTSFLQARVGRVLKDGFELAGRRFEFLAYSSSALREHSVWFVTPFENRFFDHHDRDIRWINAAEIRSTLGDFSGVANQPAKYAARMAQAFTATDPSVTILREQWEEVPDLGDKPYEHTDGVGTISPELADEIWAKLGEDSPHLVGRKIKPSSFQIRFLGYKGMVGVDENMTGKYMKLRPSMNKFKVHKQDVAEIEIARAFDRPMTCMLSRALIMILEDRGVHRDVFMRLQNDAKTETYLSQHDLARYRSLLINQSLGGSYHLGWLAEKLLNLGFDLKERDGQMSMEYGFFRLLGHYAIHHTLREIKHNSRIPVKKGWLLPGIADEGPAYIRDGEPDTNVLTLGAGEIYACIQGPEDEEPLWIEGRVIIWRSPVVHPGDVQQVFAIGKPDDDGKICSFRNLKNLVVLPSVGSRSLASKLGGGDVDGDIFYIAKDPDLFPTEHQNAASYTGADPFTLPDGRTAEIDDVCDFVVNYIGSDVLGLLSTNHLVIADQSKDGTLDKACLELARLCGLAVDYPKSGVPVDIQQCPRRLIPYNPDWSSAEVVNIDKAHYYESVRALGHMFRGLSLPTKDELADYAKELEDKLPVFQDNVSTRVMYEVRRFIPNCSPTQMEPEWLSKLFQHYLNEMRYICATHTLSNFSGTRLMEEEVVIGTILAECSQRRWRRDRIQRMKDHSRVLVRHVEKRLMDGEDVGVASREHLIVGLDRAWTAWCFAARYRKNWGAQSFGLVALALIFACIDNIETRV